MNNKPWFRLALGAAKFWLIALAAAMIFALVCMIGYTVINDPIVGLILLGFLTTVGATVVVMLGDSTEED